MLAMAVSLPAGSVFTGKLVACLFTPAMILGGLLIGTVGLLAMSAALMGHMHLWVVNATMMAYSDGAAPAIVSMTSITLSVAPGELAGTVSSLLNVARQTGGLLGAAVADAAITVVPGLAHAALMVFGLMTLLCTGAMAIAWISYRPAATALTA